MGKILSIHEAAVYWFLQLAGFPRKKPVLEAGMRLGDTGHSQPPSSPSACSTYYFCTYVYYVKKKFTATTEVMFLPVSVCLPRDKPFNFWVDLLSQNQHFYIFCLMWRLALSEFPSVSGFAQNIATRNSRQRFTAKAVTAIWTVVEDCSCQTIQVTLVLWPGLGVRVSDGLTCWQQTPAPCRWSWVRVQGGTVLVR